MEKYTYALLLVGSIMIPLVRSFEDKVRFHKYLVPLFAGIFIMSLVFISWDVIFTRNGVWWFAHEYVLGIYLLGLPIEEWLFFVVIPYCVMFIYEVLRYFFPHFVFPRTVFVVSLALAIAFIVIAALNTQRIYTLVVMLLTGLLLISQLGLRNHKTWLSHFFLTYLVSLIPFFIVNGVLTSRPVVSYNDLENLGIRLYTIPVEDSVYLMGMMLMVNMVYERVKSARNKKTASGLR